MSFTILGTGSALPAKTVTNDDMAKLVETSDEWIRTRTGIRERHVITDESVTEITFTAAQRALEMSGVSPQELDYIICPTVGGDWISPSLACMIQERLGATCPAVDVNAACSGFLYGFDYADGIFARKRAKYVLVAAAEGLSRLLNWKDRSTCVLFGDGAGAAVLGEGDSLRYLHLTAKGSLALHVPHAPGESPFETNEQPPHGLVMDGREIYRFAVSTITAELRRASEETGIPFEKVDHVLLHQANQRIMDAASKKLHLPPEKVPSSIARTANTSAASVPILLDQEARLGHLHRGDILMLCAFGAGLTSGTAVLEWTRD